MKAWEVVDEEVRRGWQRCWEVFDKVLKSGRSMDENVLIKGSEVVD